MVPVYGDPVARANRPLVRVYRRRREGVRVGFSSFYFHIICVNNFLTKYTFVSVVRFVKSIERFNIILYLQYYLLYFFFRGLLIKKIVLFMYFFLISECLII